MIRKVIMKFGSVITSLTYEGFQILRDFAHTLNLIIDFCGSLKYLKLDCVKITVSMIPSLRVLIGKLDALELHSCKMDKSTDADLFSELNQLSTLNTRSCEEQIFENVIKHRYPHLTTLSLEIPELIDESVFAEFLQSHNQIKKLEVDLGPYIMEARVPLLDALSHFSCNHLKILCIGGPFGNE